MALLEDFKLKVFVTVARVKSFTKAAEALGVSQPAVSQNISDLEKGLNIKLFERLKGEAVLTPQGEVFMNYAQRIIKAEDYAQSMFASLSPTTIRLSCSEELYANLIGPALEDFSIIHPEIQFERTLFENADLKISMAPVPVSPFDVPAESIARLRVSIYPTPDPIKNMGDISATHEKSSYFDVLYQPSQAFACTKTCRLLKDYFASLL